METVKAYIDCDQIFKTVKHSSRPYHELIIRSSPPETPKLVFRVD